jgi:hypothetical protein
LTKIRDKAYLWEAIVLSAAAVVIICLLFVKPILGIADNGDFSRIMTSSGIYDKAEVIAKPFGERYFGYFHSEYQFAAPATGGYVSTQLGIVWAAVLFNRLLLSGTTFYVQTLAVLYGAALLIAFWLLLRTHRISLRLPARIVLGILLVFVFTDIGYAAYFNSFFGEATTQTAMLLTGGCAFLLLRRERPSRWLLVAFFAAALGFAGAKIQNAPVGLLLALLGFRWWRLRTDLPWRRLVIAGSTLLAAGSIALYVTVPKELKVINQYQSVFYGVLKDSPNTQADLRDLGLSPELAVLANTNYFTANTAIPQNDPKLKALFYDKMSPSKVIFFYLTHPSRFIDKLQKAADSAMLFRPYYLGNYEQSAGMPLGAVSHAFSVWSYLKSSVLPRSLLFPAGLIAIFGITAVWRYKRNKAASIKGLIEVLGLLPFITLLGLMVPILGDGEADLTKHLFLYNLSLDCMLVVSVVWLTEQAIRGIFKSESSLHKGRDQHEAAG